MDIITIILCILFAIVDPLCYAIARSNGLPEAKGWKKIIPFCWMLTTDNTKL